MMKGLATEAQRAPSDSTASVLPLEKESDVSLVILMGNMTEQPVLAERAVGELYRRHARKMIGFCAGSFLLYRQNHEELVQRTFQKALRGAAKKARDFQSGDTAQATTRHVKLWLYRILKRTCIDARRAETLEREQRGEADLERVAVVVYDPVGEPGEAPTPRRVELVRAFARGLNDRDQAILYNTQQFYDPSTGETSMPENIHAALLKEFAMSESTLRTQRFRLLKRLHQYILQNE
ncbi:MAG: hypothetical protein WC378_05880 [Opitutaceae bacterium]|jgi:DNA-directed RNA polymerase specialized sigma24 family protein